MQSRTNLEGLGLMRKRLGSPNQQDRMIEGKLNSLKGATKYSYQAAKLKRIGIDKEDPGLINPDMVRQSYDSKVVSVDNSFGYKVGDVFEWVNTHTLWIIYLQDLDELAYFKGKIRLCNHMIKWVDDNGEEHSVYASVQGPLANDIDSIHKSYDVPNYELKVIIPKDQYSLAFFKRYTEFYLYDLMDNQLETRWRVAGVDSISQNNIITFTANEYYSNTQPGTITRNEVRLMDLDDEPVNNMITGEDTIKPKIEYTYTYHGKELNDWAWSNKSNLEVNVISQRKIKIKWNGTQRTKIEISNGSSKKEIKVESLF